MLPEFRVTLLKRLINDLDFNILYWDIETSPCEGYFWSTGEQYVNYKQIKKGKETKIITIQYMFEGDSKPQYLTWNKTKEGFDDSEMIEFFITNIMRKFPQDKLIIVGQNHKAFDHKILNERAKTLRLTPPIHNMVKIDTYKSSKQTFKTASHGLDYRSEQYGLGGKLPTSLQLWIDIVEGRKTPEEEMVPYGLKDVTDLRTIFWNDLPYYETLPTPLESLLLKAQAKCLKCESYKKPKYDLEPCRVDKKAGYECLNCGDKFTI
jgi:hypothetical protein